MIWRYTGITPELISGLGLFFPLFFSILMAIGDAKERRIPNYLTLGCLATGLAFQLGFHGWAGLANGLLGIGVGFFLLIFFYLKGGLGAGDVKALASLGAWLGPQKILYLFVYMGLSGILLVVILLWWRGLLWGKLRRLWEYLVSWVLLRSHALTPLPEEDPAPSKIKDIPYVVALAMGMAILCWQGKGS